jgi:hypothetical protein
MRHASFEATLRVLDEHPEYVHAFVRVSNAPAAEDAAAHATGFVTALGRINSRRPSRANAFLKALL